LLDGEALFLLGMSSWPDGPDCAAKLTPGVDRKTRSPSGAILSGFSWSENWQAGHSGSLDRLFAVRPHVHFMTHRGRDRLMFSRLAVSVMFPVK